MTILESLKQPVAVTDSIGNPIIMNQSAMELFIGYAKPETVYYKGQIPELSLAVSKKSERIS